jgi:hypothetical protein
MGKAMARDRYRPEEYAGYYVEMEGIWQKILPIATLSDRVDLLTNQIQQ